MDYTNVRDYFFGDFRILSLLRLHWDRWLLYGGWERIWKEEVFILIELLVLHLPPASEENHKKSHSRLSLSGLESEPRNSLTETSYVNGCTRLLLTTRLVKPLKCNVFCNVVCSVRIWRQSRQILRHYESPAAPGARVLSLRRDAILKHRSKASCFVNGY